MQTGTSTKLPISCGARPGDDREGQGLLGNASIPDESTAAANQPATDLTATVRVQQLLEAIESLAKTDSQSEIPTERLVQVDAIQEHLLEHLDELNHLLQWQVERLVQQRPSSALAGTIA